jgi:hypothetical protein
LSHCGQCRSVLYCSSDCQVCSAPFFGRFATSF